MKKNNFFITLILLILPILLTALQLRNMDLDFNDCINTDNLFRTDTQISDNVKWTYYINGTDVTYVGQFDSKYYYKIKTHQYSHQSIVMTLVTNKQIDILEEYVRNKLPSGIRWNDPAISVINTAVRTEDDDFTSDIIIKILPIFDKKMIDDWYPQYHLNDMLERNMPKSILAYYSNMSICKNNYKVFTPQRSY